MGLGYRTLPAPLSLGISFRLGPNVRMCVHAQLLRI